MMVRGRTLIILLIIAMIGSSFFTLIIVNGDNTLNIVGHSIFNNNQNIGNQNAQGNDQTPKNFDKFLEAFNKIKNSYVDKKTDQQLIDGAISGMVASLNDPHSTYMDAKQTKEFFNTLSDSFEGIGAEVTLENGRVTVISPIKNSPSDEAGLKPKDQIIKVNGESLEGLNLFEAVTKIRGPKGTKAVLEVQRPGTNQPLTITVVRDKIMLKTVHFTTLDTDKGLIGKIEITDFGDKTADEFKDALQQLEDNNIKGLIIDLRGNPGGYLKSVVSIGDLVIPNKGIIVQIESRDGDKQVYRSTMTKAKFPIVALINKGSASASEILASSLHEAGHYTLVGVTSYGKGTVQNPFELSDGSNLKITIAKWLTPNGNWIDKKGIEPDIKITQPEYYNAMPFPDKVNLKPDMNNVDVKNLQIILNGLGYKTGREDGYFDNKTEIAVKAFQKVNNLKETGIVEENTAIKLQEEIIKKIKDPKYDVQLQVSIQALLKSVK